MPNQIAPHYMSEFYNYDHDAGGGGPKWWF
jgi:hypothetical protein